MIKHRMQIFLIGAWARSFPISKLLVLACRRRETESTSHYPPMCTLPTISRIPYYIYIYSTWCWWCCHGSRHQGIGRRNAVMKCHEILTAFCGHPASEWEASAREAHNFACKASSAAAIQSEQMSNVLWHAPNIRRELPLARHGLRDKPKRIPKMQWLAQETSSSLAMSSNV